MGRIVNHGRGLPFSFAFILGVPALVASLALTGGLVLANDLSHAALAAQPIALSVYAVARPLHRR